MSSFRKRVAAVLLSSAVLFGGSCAEVDKLSQEQIGTGIGTLAGGVGGALLGKQFGSRTGQLVATLVGAVGGAWVGKRIGTYLDERDRQKAAEAVQQAAVTGRNQNWKNPESGVSGKAEVLSTKTSRQAVKVPVLKGRVEQVPPLDLIGEPYKAKANASVRAGPASDYVVVDQLSAGQTITVAGKVKGEPWYMISQGGAGSGFVSAKLLSPAPAVTAIVDKPVPQGEIEQRTVDAGQTCRTVRQTVTLTDGTTREEDVTACQGPNGWTVI
jgi:surface antigen